MYLSYCKILGCGRILLPQRSVKNLIQIFGDKLDSETKEISRYVIGGNFKIKL